MLVILDAVEFEQVESDLVVDEPPVGGILDAEGGKRSLGAEALAPLRVDAALFRHAGGAHVVEQRIERDAFAGLGIDVLVVSGLGGTGGRKRQRLMNEFFTELGEFGVGLGG